MFPRASLLSRSRSDERGGDMIWTVLFVIPFMLIITFLMVDLGTMFATRSAVTNVLRDTVRQVSAYGSNCEAGECPYAPPPASNGISFSQQAQNRLRSGPNGTCTFGPCFADQPIVVQCGRAEYLSGIAGDYTNVVIRPFGDPASDPITVGTPIGCEVVAKYPYKGVTGGVLNTPLGAGLGGLVGPFPAKVTGTTETGNNPNIE